MATNVPGVHCCIASQNGWPGFTWNVLTGQSVQLGAFTESLYLLGVHGLQTRSLLSVAAALMYCISKSHVASGLHARSVVSVGAVDSNWSALHVASAEHARLDVAVAAVDSYCTPAVQVASAAHWRFVVLVGAAVWYCDVVEHELRALHSRS